MSSPARDVFEQYENSPFAPWNEPDDVAVCDICDTEISGDDEFNNVCDECMKENDDDD